jgi:hypothetical protein
MLILVHQTNYCGDIIQGQPPPQSISHHIPPCLCNAKSIGLQLGTGMHFRGCCNRTTFYPVRGQFTNFKRQVVLDEFHFLHHCIGPWDLYLLPVGDAREQHPESHCPFFQFCLVPQNHYQDLPAKDKAHDWPGWRFLGECHPGILRIDLDETIRMTLKKSFGLHASEKVTEYHCHVEAFLPEFIDHRQRAEFVARQQQRRQQNQQLQQQQQQSENREFRPLLGPCVNKTHQQTKQPQLQHPSKKQDQVHHRPPLGPCNINTRRMPQKTQQQQQQQQPKKQSSWPTLGPGDMNAHLVLQKTKHQQEPPPKKQASRNDHRCYLGSPYFR